MNAHCEIKLNSYLDIDFYYEDDEVTTLLVMSSGHTNVCRILPKDLGDELHKRALELAQKWIREG